MEGTSNVKVPDVLGEAQRAQAVLSHIVALQNEALQIELQATRDGKKPSDVFQGDQTYQERAQEIEEAQKRLLSNESNAVRERVAELAKAQRGG